MMEAIAARMYVKAKSPELGPRDPPCYAAARISARAGHIWRTLGSPAVVRFSYSHLAPPYRIHSPPCSITVWRCPISLRGLRCAQCVSTLWLVQMYSSRRLSGHTADDALPLHVGHVSMLSVLVTLPEPLHNGHRSQRPERSGGFVMRVIGWYSKLNCCLRMHGQSPGGPMQ